jgi:Zn-dependent protease
MDLQVKIFLYLIIIMSAVFHEYAHGWAAFSMGDPTAKKAGRLTLNPIAHIDPFGTVILPLFLMIVGGMFIGYAKPVPYNPYNLSDQKHGPAKVAAAGPTSNFVIAFLFAMLLRFVTLSPIWITLVSVIVYVNIILALFNLIPIPPLDGAEFMKTFTDFDFSFGSGFLGTFLALMLAFTFLPSLAQAVFQLFTGMSF